MGLRFFSTKDRPFHLGPYPIERLVRIEAEADLSAVPPMTPLDFQRLDTPHSLINAMGEYQAMMDAIREATVNPVLSDIPDDLQERANHLKSFGYFVDASMMGVCRLPDAARLKTPYRNPEIDRLAEDLRTRQTKTLASGIDVIMADLKESMEAPSGPIDAHTHAIVCLYEHYRDPREDEPGADWIAGVNPYRGCLRATEAAVCLSNYLGLLGYPSRRIPDRPRMSI